MLSRLVHHLPTLFPVSPPSFTVLKGWEKSHSVINPNYLQHPWTSDALDSLVWPYCSYLDCVIPLWFLQQWMEILKHKDMCLGRVGDPAKVSWYRTRLFCYLWSFVCCWLFLQIAAEPEIRMLLIKTCWDGDRMCLPDVSKIGNLLALPHYGLEMGKLCTGFSGIFILLVFFSL